MQIQRIIFFLLSISLIPIVVNAKYIEPITIIDGRWGNGDSDFGFESGDTADSFPGILHVDKLSNIIIGDGVNHRIKIYNYKGILKNNFKYKDISPIGGWPMNLKVKAGVGIFSIYEKLQKYDYSGKLIWSINVPGFIDYWILDNGEIFYQEDRMKYLHYSSTGQLLKVYEMRPLEIGIVYEGSSGNGKYKSSIEFPDFKYKVNAIISRYSRDILANLYVGQTYAKEYNPEIGPITCYRVIRVDRCTDEEYIFELPKSEYEPLTSEEKQAPTSQPKLGIEYGEPVVSPFGDLYCWARTKTHYKILKWTWQGPDDAPQSLQISAGVAGLKLNWQKPVKEIESITGYQILRSTEICGPFNEVTTIKKDKLVFEDQTIKPPWKYYYAVKAVRDKKYSGDSNKVYMQWK